jgi:hypothetical protein
MLVKVINFIVFENVSSDNMFHRDEFGTNLDIY